MEVGSSNSNDDLGNLTNESSSGPRDDCIRLIKRNTSVSQHCGSSFKALTTKFGETSAMLEVLHLFLTAPTLVICSASCNTAHFQNYRVKDAS